jgi:hypothetical protein
LGAVILWIGILLDLGQPGGGAIIKRDSSVLDEPKRLRVTKSLSTSPLSQPDHIIFNREEPTGQSIDLPRRQQNHEVGSVVGRHIVTSLEDLTEPGHPPASFVGFQGMLCHRRADGPQLDGKDLDPVRGGLQCEDLGKT